MAGEIGDGGARRSLARLSLTRAGCPLHPLAFPHKGLAEVGLRLNSGTPYPRLRAARTHPSLPPIKGLQG